MLLIKRFNFVFIKDLSAAVSQSNVQAVMAENEEQHALSNIIYIKFKNYCSFSWRPILKEVLLNVHKPINQWISFFRQFCMLRVCSFTKNMLLYMYFPRFLGRFIVVHKEFLEILRTYVSRKHFSSGC